MGRIIRRILLIVAVLAGIGAIAWAFMPTPVPVDLAEVSRGPMQVTVDEEGRTRIKERYVVSAPLGGRLRRIDLDPGDPVTTHETVLAVIEPTDPNLLDPRSQAEAAARVRAAEAAVNRSEAVREQARAELDLAEDRLADIVEADRRGAARPQELEVRQSENRTAQQRFRAAQFAEDIAQYELELARASLLYTDPSTGDAPAPNGAQMILRAPIDGRVLRVFQESVAVVTPGTALLEVGDPGDLELEIDVLSTDAVGIEPGAQVIIEHWGGPGTLEGRVRLVEPSAFTKISALGVEEQRVWVIADLVSPPTARASLGHGYRVEARIVTWRDEDVVRVPEGALFRVRGNGPATEAPVDGWAVFVATAGGVAEHRAVEIGRRNGIVAEVRTGLAPGDSVIMHPDDRINDGVKVESRNEA